MSDRRDQFVARVLANVPLCREHYCLVLRVDHFPPTHPGQFVQVMCRDPHAAARADGEHEWTSGAPIHVVGDELAGRQALLRRPFSLAGRRDSADGVELQIIHRVVGTGTAWLSGLKAGDEVGLLGPLGNAFTPPEPEGLALLVGGGVGIPPMLYLAERLAGRKAVAFCGAVGRDLLPLTVTADAPIPDANSIDPLYNIDEFARHGIPAVISTDDGSYGYRGYITQALEAYVDRYIMPSPRHVRDAVCIYTCGPEPMMKRVASFAISRELKCQVSVERAMACGMGTCQSCVIRVKRCEDEPAGQGRPWVYKLACTDGPVFQAADLLW